MIEFLLGVGVQQTGITFTTTPEHIVLSSQSDGGIECCFYLCTGMCNHGKVWIG